MDIKTEMDGTEYIVALSGELNTITAPQLSEAIDPYLEKITKLTLDFANCDYVSSAGLRVLLAAFKTLKKNKAGMVLINVGEGFTDVLESTGLDAVFDIE